MLEYHLSYGGKGGTYTKGKVASNDAAYEAYSIIAKCEREFILKIGLL